MNLVYTVAIPTMNRPEELARAIRQSLAQTPAPRNILVVDDGKLDMAQLEAMFGGSKEKLIYHRKARPGLIASLTKCADLCQTPWMLIIDDDIYLRENFMEQMADWLVMAPDADKIVGLAGYPIQPDLDPEQPRAQLRRFLDRIFLLGGGREGNYLPSGVCTDYGTGYHPDAPWRVRHVPGGLGLWRTEVLRQYGFDAWYEGYAYGNDKEIAYRISADHPLYCVPGAIAGHVKSPRSRTPNQRLGEMRILNQHRFYTRLFRKSRWNDLAYGWSLFGLMAIHALGVLFSANRSQRMTEFKGMVGALRKIRAGWRS